MKIVLAFISFVSLLLPLKSLQTTEIKATFSGGCFWCSESHFEKLIGISDVISGFSGEKTENASYKQVSSGKTQLQESVQFFYNPEIISYEFLLEYFWMHIDPTDNNGQFVDRGNQYRATIFYHDQEQKQLATLSKKYLEDSLIFKKKIATEIKKYLSFYPAEKEHQNFYKQSIYSSLKYKYYYNRSGRPDFIKKHWRNKTYKHLFLPYKKIYPSPSQKTLQKNLSKIQFDVTQNNGTERSFQNKYWDNKKAGIYVDIVSKEPLFASEHKYKSGTGWPSFTRPIDPHFVIYYIDKSYGMERFEIRSRYANSHLGHIFKDGPAPYHLRFCINSAALEFVAKDKMQSRGYQKYLPYALHPQSKIPTTE